ncbi:hypothetical protein PN36_30140 [Candidatus Thiomargarita nelsonii]|uniref:Uncharacterized protein n=1 Tax=Candidatus Thiomargarita nelsonii TaxID=1003181 RepID=A0A0A6P817_9GAMM|nr:hypothetical protein PN36_30140 [Candidatus Thiomargarita nelsonii]
MIMNTLETTPTIEINGVKIQEGGLYRSTLRTMVKILQNPLKILHYNQEKNQYNEIYSQGNNRFYLPDGIEYCRLRGGGYAILYQSKEQREEEKNNFHHLQKKLAGQSTLSLRQKQCPEIWTEFEYENPVEGKRYGLYLKAKKRTLGKTDQRYMDNGVVLSPGTYLKDHVEELEILNQVKIKMLDFANSL